MRQEQEIRTFLHSLGCSSKYEGDRFLVEVVKLLTFQRHKVQYSNFTAVLHAHNDLEKILRFGMLVGHGYPFTYKGDAVVLTGEVLFGESPLARTFQEHHGSEILAQGDLLAFDKEGDGNFQVYRHTEEQQTGLNRLNARHWNQASSNYSGSLANNNGYPLRFIVHVRKSDQLREEGGRVSEHPDLSALLDEYHLSLPHRSVEREATLASTFPELKNVKLLEYTINPNFYRGPAYLEKVFSGVEFQLDMWNFLRSAE